MCGSYQISPVGLALELRMLLLLPVAEEARPGHCCRSPSGGLGSPTRDNQLAAQAVLSVRLRRVSA